MAIVASDIIRRARTTLHDQSHVRWPESDHIDAINDAQSAILIALPDLFEHHNDVALVAGNEQAIPSDGYLLFDVLWNVNADSTQGRRITKAARSALDRHRASWSESGENETVRHWAQDKGQKAKYYVAPRQPVGTSKKVRLRYAKRPDPITSSADNLNVPDEMDNAIYYFMVSRLLEKDEKFSGSPQAQSFMQKFGMSVKVRDIGEDDAESTETVNEGS